MENDNVISTFSSQYNKYFSSTYNNWSEKVTAKLGKSSRLARHGVIVICNSNCNRKLPDIAVIVIDCIFPKVIVIDSKVIDNSLLHFYNLLQHMVMLLPKSWLFVSCKYQMAQTTEHCSNNTSPERGCWDNSVGLYLLNPWGFVVFA